jgi:hypothetical protein
MQVLTFTFAAVAIGALVACQGVAPPAGEANSEYVARSIAAADLFQSRLQSTLGEAMATGGPIAAIAVCAETAPAISAEVSAEKGAVVRRVSLRPRNPAAATDGALTARLEALEKMPLDDQGAPAAMNWIEGEGPAASFHVLRAVIMRDRPCATCHGAELADDVRDAIAERYPQDQAIGFDAGDLRGAILVSWWEYDSDRFGEKND